MNDFEKVIKRLVVAIVLGFLLSYPVMLLWNGCLVPAISILREVSWMQMFGIMIMSNVLFKDRK